MFGIPIRKIERRDIPQLANVLTEAFDEDPAMRWAMREDAKRLPSLRDFFTYSIEDTLRYSEGTTTEDLRACALWIPPQAQQEKSPPLFNLWMLPRYLNWSSFHKLSRWFKFLKLFEEKRPKIPHFYLDFLGVHPDQQGQGYATALLRHKLIQLDEQMIPAYLESTNPRNNRLYQRNGFEIIDEIHLPNGPLIWCMWRNPRSTHPISNNSQLNP
jgi:ribosomal protein S18 acetylase RimI-like enzyme